MTNNHPMKQEKEHSNLIKGAFEEARHYPNMARQRVGHELQHHQCLRLQSQTTQPCHHLQCGGSDRFEFQMIRLI